MKPRISTRLGAVRTYAMQHSNRHSAMKPPTRKEDPLRTSPNATTSPLPDNLTFVHRAPPTAPSPFSVTTSPASAFLRPPTPVARGTPLPPTTRTDRPPAAGRVSQTVIQKIIALRKANPAKYTRGTVSRMYGVTQGFVGMVAPSKQSYRKQALKQRDEEHARKREKWGERKTLSKDVRQKRKEFW